MYMHVLYTCMYMYIGIPVYSGVMNDNWFLGDDSLELETLEGQFKASADKYRHKRKQLRQLESDIQVHTRTLITCSYSIFLF